jgi:ribonuclease P protein component
MDYSFPKNERIVSQKLIDELFTSGQGSSLVAFPLRAVYLLKSQTSARPKDACYQRDARNLKSQILVSVPKKHFKHAVDRNRIKRQVREAYRKNKHLLTLAPPLCPEPIPEQCSPTRSLSTLLIAFVWMAPQHQPSDVVENRVVTLLKKIAVKLG